MPYIDRGKAFNVLTEYYHHKTLIQKESLKEALSRVPTADVRKNVHAHWVIEREQMPNGEIAVGQFCSNCDYPQYLTTRFCPNCGAKMDEEESTMEEYMYGQEGSEEDGSL